MKNLEKTYNDLFALNNTMTGHSLALSLLFASADAGRKK